MTPLLGYWEPRLAADWRRVLSLCLTASVLSQADSWNLTVTGEDLSFLASYYRDRETEAQVLWWPSCCKDADRLMAERW